MLHAPSSNSLLSCKHPRTACTYLNHQCTYAAQTKAVRNLAAFTFIALPLPEFWCSLTCITTQKKQPEKPNFELRVTNMWKSQVCMIKVETRAWLRHRSCKIILEKWGCSFPRPSFRLGLDTRLKFVFCPLTAAPFQCKERQKHPVLPYLSNLSRIWVFRVYSLWNKARNWKSFFIIIILFSPQHISFSDFSELFLLSQSILSWKRLRTKTNIGFQFLYL